MKLPEGWPTEEMIEAGLSAYKTHIESEGVFSTIRALTQAFEAMLAAAPTPPAQEDEHKTQQK